MQNVNNCKILTNFSKNESKKSTKKNKKETES